MFSSDVKFSRKAFKCCVTEFLGGDTLPSVQGGVESGVDATEPYSSGRRQDFT